MKTKLQNLKKPLVASALAVAASVGTAHAALPTEATDTLGQIVADIMTVGGYVLGAAALVLSFRMVKRAMGL